MDNKIRQKILFIAFCLVAFVYVIRLIQLQIVDDSYFRSAQNNVLQEQTIYPARGLIYDRNGELLVYNDAVYDLSVIPIEVKTLDTALFCEVLGITAEQFRFKFEKLKRQKGYAPYKKSIFDRQISIPVYAAFQEHLYDFRGFYVDVRTDRKYAHSNAAHVMGYISEVTDKDIENSNGYYQMGDFKGISGVERSYEKELGGIKGIKYILVDSKARTQGRYKNGEFDTPSVSGKNINLSIDYKLQALGEELMQNKIGSVIAIEPSTGEILAMVSTPSYDPNLFVGRDRGKHYMELLLDPSKPLFNRSIAAPYPPGSIFKVLMALTGQQEKVLTPATSYGCSRGYLFVGCHAHGSPLQLRGGIAVSCNSYFCQVYRSVVNNPAYKLREDAYKNFRKHITSFGLGNITPHIVKRIDSKINPDPEYNKKHWSTIDTSYFQVVIDGMQDVVEHGTAYIAKIPGIEICGKTGTAQNPHGKDHSIFFAFAPKIKPKIAIAVVVENAGFGATYAAPIASLMMEEYLTKKHDTRIVLYEHMIKANLTHKNTNDTAATKTR
ncbi:MAG: penicillin-binding transpeptidase domain-containing protein [Bacteroidetes bacterium]|nr:penicillin-binding transpeptidase domain-containing protein [Bacteroidota bacterium]